MITPNHMWEEETKRQLSAIQTEATELDKQLEEINNRRVELAREADAYKTALQSYLKRTGRQSVVVHNLEEILNEQPNHKERIKRIAEENNGVAKVNQTSNLLFDLKFIRSKTRANAYRIVYSLLLEMVNAGEFVKIAPSTFQLQHGSNSMLI